MFCHYLQLIDITASVCIKLKFVVLDTNFTYRDHPCVAKWKNCTYGDVTGPKCSKVPGLSFMVPAQMLRWSKQNHSQLEAAPI